MTIQILGTGCGKCRQITEHAETAARALGLPYRLEKITDIKDIMQFGVMATPALAVDGKVKLVGKGATSAEIESLLNRSIHT